MNNVIIDINTKSGVASLRKFDNIIGNQHQNLKNKLVFEMSEFIEGTAWIEYEIGGKKNYALMEKIEKGYQIDIKSCLLISDYVNIDLKITEEETPNGIPIFVSTIVCLRVMKTINAEEEEPEQYPSWLEVANAKLSVIDKAIEYATEQGDYAKEQADINIETVEEATKLIENFEKTINQYTTSFNSNANNKTDKFNTNATLKTNEFNDNANTKTSDFNKNVEEKNSEYNNNAISKSIEYNTNADVKLNEYNTNATEKIEEYNSNAENLISNVIETRNELERIKNAVLETGEASGTFIHLKDSTMAEYQELEVDGTCEQGENPSPEYPQEITVIENSLKVISCNKNLIDIDLIPTNENSDIQTTKNNNGSITIKGNSTSQWINVTNHKYCPFNKNVNYCFSIDKVVTYNVQLRLVFEDNTHEVKIIRAGETSVNFSVSRKVSYYYIYIYNGNGLGEMNDTLFIQLEEGTQVTSSEEHLETVINANLGNEFVGKVNDAAKDILRVSYNEEDGEYHLYLDKVIGKITFDGTQNISGVNASLTNTTRLHFANILPYTCTEPSYFKSNRLLYKGVWAADEEGMYFTKYSKDVIMRINKTTIGTTKDEINNWFSKNPMEVYYKINEPYTIDLGVVEMPITYDEATNLFTDSNLLPAINAKYYRNFTETVRNLQINNETLKNELASFENRLAALEAVQVSVVNESEVIEQ